MTFLGLFKHQLDYWLELIFKIASIFGILTFTLQTDIKHFKYPIALGFALASLVSLVALIVALKNVVHFMYEEKDFMLKDRYRLNEPIIYRSHMLDNQCIKCSYFPINMAFAVIILILTTVVLSWISGLLFNLR